MQPAVASVFEGLLVAVCFVVGVLPVVASVFEELLVVACSVVDGLPVVPVVSYHVFRHYWLQ